MSSVVRKFLDSVSDVLNVVSSKGVECNHGVFLAASITAIAVTSFTSKTLVVLTSFTASAILTALSGVLRDNLKRVVSALIYVAFFSLIALSPLLLRNELSNYAFYVFRALGAAALLLTTSGVLGWAGVAKALQELKLPSLAEVVTTYPRMLSTLIKDVSKSLLCREARQMRKAGFRDIPTYSTLVGDLFIKGCSRGWRTSLAMSARTLHPQHTAYRDAGFKLTKLDLFMVSVALTEAVIQLIWGFGEWPY